MVHRGWLTSCLALAVLGCGDALPPQERPIPAELPADARPAHRRLPVDGAANLRDLGGYTTRDGRALRWAVLYRSDALADLSDDDVAYLERLGLRRVVASTRSCGRVCAPTCWRPHPEPGTSAASGSSSSGHSIRISTSSRSDASARSSAARRRSRNTARRTVSRTSSKG